MVRQAIPSKWSVGRARFSPPILLHFRQGSVMSWQNGDGSVCMPTIAVEDTLQNSLLSIKVEFYTHFKPVQFPLGVRSTSVSI